MATNPYVNKVVYDGSTLIDLSNDTLSSANQLLQGVVAHDRTGATVTGTIEDGDEIGYGSTGILGTWYFNSVIDFTGISNGEYYIDFTSDNIVCSAFQILAGSGFYGITYMQIGAVYSKGIFGNGWTSESYRTVTITGGTDATNPDFIAWLTANATKQ